jgi:hypothetical protein
MYPRNSQFSTRADGMPEAMPPSAFERNTPTPKATPKLTPVVPAVPKKQVGASIEGSKSIFVPKGSGASAAFGGSLGGGGGPMGRK